MMYDMEYTRDLTSTAHSRETDLSKYVDRISFSTILSRKDETTHLT